MILSCHNLGKSFGGETLFTGGDFRIDDKDKTAIVGINGAGKSTLLKMIVGELSPDEGEIVISRGKTIGYLAQHQNLSSEKTVYEEVRAAKEPVFAMEREIRRLEESMKNASGAQLKEMMESYTRLSHEFEMQDGYAAESQIVGVLKGMGFSEEDFDKRCSTLSGGQKTRVSLGRLLLTQPDCILLDEPTNHLDIESIVWLEGYLNAYPGAVILVAHDRYFLDRVVSKVIEVEGKKLTVYSGNYTAYAQKKKMVREAQLKAYLNQQREIAHQEAVIDKLKSFNREKSIKRAESREKMLAKIDRIERPEDINDAMVFTLEPSVVSGKDVLRIENLSKSFGSQLLYDNVNIDIRRGERVAVIGNNGTGKTTLLKIITGKMDADTGSCTLGSKVQIGYYDQEQQQLTEENTLFEEISDSYPDLDNTKIRSTLAAFLFTGDDVFKKVSSLSGGERGRLALAKLILSPCNFLILDEPTNHLDMTSKEILEQALSSYTGTVLCVSHDRYFVNQTATRILELTHGMFINYLGNYDYYLEKREELTAAALAAKEAKEGKKGPRGNASGKKEPAAAQTGAPGWKAQKAEQARKRKHENDVKKAEDEIAAREKRISEIDALLAQEAVYTDMQKLLDLNHEKEEVQKELDAWMEKWEELLEEEE